jgi:hypothetical protein
VRKDTLYRVANRARFVAPAILMSLAYMLYRSRGAYFQDGLLTCTTHFRKDPSSAPHIGSGRQN